MFKVNVHPKEISKSKFKSMFNKDRIKQKFRKFLFFKSNRQYFFKAAVQKWQIKLNKY